MFHFVWIILGTFQIQNYASSRERGEGESGRAKFPQKPGTISNLERWLCWHLVASSQMLEQLLEPKQPKIPQGEAGSETPRLINGGGAPHLHLCKYANKD